MNKKRGELDLHIVFEADDEERYERMRKWVISTFKEAARYSQEGMIAIGVYDDQVMVAHSVIGTPTPEAQSLIEQAFETSPVTPKEVA